MKLKMIVLPSLLVALPLVTAGCNKGRAEQPPVEQTVKHAKGSSGASAKAKGSEMVEINAGEASVRAGEGRAEVKAGEASVRVDEERGEVSVRAPGASIEVKEGDKKGGGYVKINAGGVKIEVPDVELD
jgi:ferric-dicitrate binding protein FerR (iron transport regulator)